MAMRSSQTAKWILLPLLLACGRAAAQPQPEARAGALSALRQTVAARGGVDAVNGKIAAARQLMGEPAFDRELARLEELSGYVLRFWEHAEGVAKQLKGTDELMVGEQRVAVVEYVDGNLVLRVAGENKSYSRANMPGRLVLALAGKELNMADPGTKVHAGAFLALDGKGDRKLARQYWDEAAKAGLDVARLLPELDVPQPPVPATPPEMTPAIRGQLAERNFALRRQTGTTWTREPTGMRLNQNAEGRLEMQAPVSDKTPLQVITKRTFTGDFRTAFIVEAKDQPLVVGMYAAADGGIGRTVSVPPGCYLVEISRTAGKYAFKLGERTIEAAASGEEKPRMPLVIGWQLQPGQSAVLSAFEVAGR